MGRGDGWLRCRAGTPPRKIRAQFGGFADHHNGLLAPRLVPIGCAGRFGQIQWAHGYPEEEQGRAIRLARTPQTDDHQGVVFAVALMVICFQYVGLVANGHVGGAAAILFGMCLVALYVFWDKSTERINERWGEGARGESKVGAELERLHKQGFYVFHDWYSGRGNVDHFAIGPQGVFAVETKAFKGEVTCEGDRLLVNGKPVPGKDVAKQAMGEAMDVKRLVRESSGLDPFVHAILCFSRAEVSCYGAVGNVEVTG